MYPNFYVFVAIRYCDWLCPGDSAPLCGGFNHLAIYKTAIPIGGLYLTPAGISGLKVTKTMDVNTFDIDVISAPNDVVYAMDYGAGRTSFNTTGMQQNRFTVPGEQLVTLYATDSAGTMTVYLTHIPIDCSCLMVFLTLSFM